MTTATLNSEKLLILGAFPPELDPLREALVGERFCFAETGVGIAEAAARSTAAILEFKPERVLFVGSLGSADTNCPLLTPVAASSVSLLDYGTLTATAYMPAALHTTYDADELWRAWQNITVGRFYSTLSITNSPTLMRTLYPQPASTFENLELFGVACAANNLQIKWNALGCVTNYPNAEANSQWQANYLKAAAATRSVILDLIDRGLL